MARINNLYEARTQSIPQKPLGRTGYKVTIYSLGGQGALQEHGGKDNCLQIIRRAYELGINYFDTSPVYGPSELYYGEALEGIRNKIFLATKTDDRTRDGSLKLLEKSLKRLRTDHLDLWQIHHLEDMANLKRATSKTGALQALIGMQEQKVVKHLGFTGHGHPQVLIEAARRYPFDTVLCPVNPTDRHMAASFIDTVLPAANLRNMGIIGMKLFAQGYLFHPRGITTTWEILSYALSHNISTAIVGINSIAQLEENVAIARSFTKLTPSQKRNIEAKTEGQQRRGCFFRREFGGYGSQKTLKKFI